MKSLWNWNHVAARSHTRAHSRAPEQTGCNRSDVLANVAKPGLPSRWDVRETISEDTGLIWVRFPLEKMMERGPPGGGVTVSPGPEVQTEGK